MSRERSWESGHLRQQLFSNKHRCFTFTISIIIEHILADGWLCLLQVSSLRTVVPTRHAGPWFWV